MVSFSRTLPQKQRAYGKALVDAVEESLDIVRRPSEAALEPRYSDPAAGHEIKKLLDLVAGGVSAP